ncbi:MAG: RDD family protein [Smithella sp.]
MPYEYPSIIRRYLSSVVDGLFILSIIIFASYVFQGARLNAWTSRVAIILFMFFAYEALFTSIFCTIGQKITGIRVREQYSLQHISIPAAYLRSFVKYTLGIISFLRIGKLFMISQWDQLLFINNLYHRINK